MDSNGAEVPPLLNIQVKSLDIEIPGCTGDEETFSETWPRISQRRKQIPTPTMSGKVCYSHI